MSDDRAPRFADFIAGQRRALLGLAGSLTGDGVEAEDIVTDVVGRIWERWDQVGGAERPGAYARRMVVNEFLTRKRRQRRLHLTPRMPEDLLLAEDHAGGQAVRDELRARLQGLPGRQRAAIALRYYADLPDEQIAVMLGCATGTVRSLISRALTTLRVDPTPDAQPTDLDAASDPHTSRAPGAPVRRSGDRTHAD